MCSACLATYSAPECKVTDLICHCSLDLIPVSWFLVMSGYFTSCNWIPQEPIPCGEACVWPGDVRQSSRRAPESLFTKSIEKAAVHFTCLRLCVGVILPEIYVQTFPDRNKDSSVAKYIETLPDYYKCRGAKEVCKTLQCSVTSEKHSDDISDSGEACCYSAQSPTFPDWHLSLLRHKLQQNWNLNSRAAFVLPEDSCSCFYSWSPVLLVSRFVLSLKTAKGSSARSSGWFEAMHLFFFFVSWVLDCSQLQELTLAVLQQTSGCAEWNVCSKKWQIQHDWLPVDFGPLLFLLPWQWNLPCSIFISFQLFSFSPLHGTCRSFGGVEASSLLWSCVDIGQMVQSRWELADGCTCRVKTDRHHIIIGKSGRRCPERGGSLWSEMLPSLSYLCLCQRSWNISVSPKISEFLLPLELTGC